ncbi:MAG: M48 family metallopeptidase [Endomicrobia bacterium]|nr:M48 family metallopeptidase [Endomicrobiia bacterium]
METIKIEEIEAVIERKKIRNIYISINSVTGVVEVTAPLKASFNTLESFFKSKLKWIRKHKAKISKRPPRIQNLYVSGEMVEVFGKKYELKAYDYNKKPKVFLNFDSIDLYIKYGADLATKREVIYNFYKSELENIIPEYISKWEKIFNIQTEQSALKFLFKNVQGMLFGSDNAGTILKSPVKLCFKKMKGRWGSCNISDKKITLNTELAKKSLRCIEYVTAHELLHLRERKHNKNFKDRMKKAFPDWKNLEAELESA